MIPTALRSGASPPPTPSSCYRRTVPYRTEISTRCRRTVCSLDHVFSAAKPLILSVGYVTACLRTYCTCLCYQRKGGSYYTTKRQQTETFDRNDYCCERETEQACVLDEKRCRVQSAEWVVSSPKRELGEDSMLRAKTGV